MFTFPFNSVVCIAVICDAIILGVEASDRSLGDPYSWIGNCAIALVMSCEVFMKVRSFGTRFLCDPWDVIDVACVWVTIFDAIECLIYGQIKRSLWLRALSLIRLPRFCRCVPRIQSITQSIITQFLLNLEFLVPLSFYSVSFLLLLGFVGGVILTSDVLPQLYYLRAPPGGGWAHLRSYIGDISRSVFSSFQALTLDSWFSHIERPLMDGNRWVAAVVILIIVLGASVIYTGLLVGTFVDQAQRTSRKRNEALCIAQEKRRGDIRSIIHDALSLEFNSSSISVEEIITFTESHDNVLEGFQELDITTDEICGLWKALDPYGLERIPVSKVRIALERLHAFGRGRDLLELQSSLSHAFVSVTKMKTRVDNLNQTLLRALETVNRAHFNLTRSASA